MKTLRQTLCLSPHSVFLIRIESPSVRFPYVLTWQVWKHFRYWTSPWAPWNQLTGNFMARWISASWYVMPEGIYRGQRSAVTWDVSVWWSSATTWDTLFNRSQNVRQIRKHHPSAKAMRSFHVLVRMMAWCLFSTAFHYPELNTTQLLRSSWVRTGKVC